MANLLDRYRDQELDLDALCGAAEDLLRESGIEPGDDRVSAYPDKRTVRYYQSLGLLDRPVRYEGRKAIYAYGHLLRLVAVKLLQAEGQSLAQVQGVVPSVTREQLELAVREALQLPPQGAPKAVAVTPGRSLVCRELRPGVLLTLDPDRVSDPEAVVAAVRRALSDLNL